ncbi:amidase [Marinobacter sp. S6332]|uniref:amidase n=1 Tax=Marinobacter sp. S6332 TaxID=2926403 RepID=UPI001FF43155|nr:amidase [Marinobacter sp. S6332]MCK0162923.1 amidase [Marinobacter sp. S6332]
MTTKPLNQLSLTEAVNAIERGDTSAEAIINACYDQIDAREPQVSAWQYSLTREQYLQAYRANEEFYKNSRLKGLPVGVKDTIDTASMPTEMGASLHVGRQPVDDASCVALIQQAGGIVLGKTVTTEFAYFQPGTTANPKNLQHTPGGSSSGSAAAVADYMVPASLGSQTAASVIRPAAYCGTVGYVGSCGEFSSRGIQPLAQSLDSLGFFARSVDDIVVLRSVLLANPATTTGASTEAPVKPTKILLCPGSNVGDTDADMNAAMADLATQLQHHGIETPELDSCDLINRLVGNHETVMAYEVYRNLAVERQHADTLSESFRGLLQEGEGIPRADYLAALSNIAITTRWLWHLHPDVDAILAPAAPGAAPEGLGATGKPHMSRPWQAMGLPVITLPGLTNAAGLPLGVQLIGKSREDEELLQTARWVHSHIEGLSC